MCFGGGRELFFRAKKGEITIQNMRLNTSSFLERFQLRIVSKVNKFILIVTILLLLLLLLQ